MIQRHPWLPALAAAVLVAGLAAPRTARAAAAASDSTRTPVYVWAGTDGPFTVSVLDTVWTGQTRDRMLPVRIYLPEGAPGALPVILISPDGGGTRESLAYLARAWAARGYAVATVAHPGAAAARTPQKNLDRVLDIHFVVNQLRQAEKEPGPLSGRLDLERVGIAGCGYGAQTALAEGGAYFQGPEDRVLRMPNSRIRGAVLLSPPVPSGQAFRDTAYARIRIPCFFYTGTADEENGTAAADRRLPFDRIEGVEELLIVFKNADRAALCGDRDGGPGKDDPWYRQIVSSSALAFWDSVLKGNKTGGVYLGGGELARALQQGGTLETKP